MCPFSLSFLTRKAKNSLTTSSADSLGKNFQFEFKMIGELLFSILHTHLSVGCTRTALVSLPIRVGEFVVVGSLTLLRTFSVACTNSSC